MNCIFLELIFWDPSWPWYTEAVESEILDGGNYVVAKEQGSDLEWQVAVSPDQKKKKIKRQEQHANAKAYTQHGNPNTQ